MMARMLKHSNYFHQQFNWSTFLNFQDPWKPHKAELTGIILCYSELARANHIYLKIPSAYMDDELNSKCVISFGNFIQSFLTPSFLHFREYKFPNLGHYDIVGWSDWLWDWTHKQAIIVLLLRALWVKAKRQFLVKTFNGNKAQKRRIILFCVLLLFFLSSLEKHWTLTDGVWLKNSWNCSKCCV